MKIKTLKTVTISLGLLNAYTLFAQIENNLKAEGYKLEEMQSQITHNKKTALLLEDLFEKPYLQMDPNIVEGIQEGIEGLITREKPKTPSVKLPPITGPNTSFNETPTVRLDIQDSLPDTHEPKVTLPPLTRPNTDEAKYNILKEKNVTVQSPFQQTVQLNGTTSEQVVHLVQSQPPQEVSSERLQKTLLQIEADRTLIETWKAMEMKMKEKEKEAIDLAVENENEVINWNNAGQSFYNAAEKLEKAIEAERKGKTEIAIKWHEVVEQQVLSAEQYKQSAKAEIEGNKEDFNRFWKAAQEIEKKVNELTEEASMGPKSTENSSDEEESDSDYLMMNPSTVEGAEEAIRNFFIGERRFLPPAESTQLGDSEGEEINNTTVAIHSEEAATQENSRKEMALLVCCDKWLAETRCITKPNQILSDYLIDVIQRGANHKLVKDFEKYWSYVLKARELGDAPLALGWIQVAEDIQQAIEDNIKVAAVKQNNKDNRLSSLWQKSAQSTLKLAQNREKCIKAGMFSETPEIVNGWKNIVEGSEIIANYFRAAATAYTLRKPEYNRFNIAAIFMERSVSGLEETVNILKMNAASTEERDETLALWEKIVQQYKDTAKYYYQVANAIVGEFHLKEQVINNKSIDENLTFKRLDLVADPLDYSNELFVKTGYDRLNGITTFAEESTSQLKNATALLKQATKEGETNLKEFANLRIKIAEQYQKLFEYVCQTASILSSGNKVNINCFQQENIFIVRMFLEKASIQLYNATRANELNRIELAELWFTTAKQNQETAVHVFQTAKNCLSGNVIDCSRIEQAKELSKNSEDPLEQAAIKLEKHLDSEVILRAGKF